MKSEEMIGEESAALRCALTEWEQIAAQLLEVVYEAADREQSANWRPHRDQIAAAVMHFRNLCRAQLEQIGVWREDELQPEEVREWIWGEGDRLAKWLQRMTLESEIVGT